MADTRPRSPSAPLNESARAPQAYCDALADLVQVGLKVARLVGAVADAETALAEAPPHIGVEASLPSAPIGSMAEAIMADQAAVAASDLREKAVARANTVARAFARVSRAVRMTIALAERLDRGWARRGGADDRRAMARRQIARAVEDAIGREADGERAERLTEALADRLESLDVEDELADRPVEDILREIYRDLGLRPARDVCPPMPDAPAKQRQKTPVTGGIEAWQGNLPRRRPDG